MEVQVVYLQNPPLSLRLTDEDRRTGRLVTVPPSTSGGPSRVSAAAVAEAARAQQIAPAGPLQLSLHGMVLSPEDNVAELMEGLPPGAWSRVVFLLSPAAQGDCAPSPKRVGFADDLASSPPAVNRAGSSMPEHCVFRESWLKPQRCVHCNCTRTQHYLFEPTRQHRIDSAMTRSNSRHGSPMGHLRLNSSSASVSDKKPMSYYADPQQWEPKRNAQYHAKLEVCSEFVSLWGTAAVCAQCRHVRSAHEIQAPPTSSHQEYEWRRRSLSRNLSTASSPPRRTLSACDRFIPVWDNNHYCATCYMPKGMHSQQAQRSPHPRVIPRQQTKAVPPAQVDWLAALPHISETAQHAAHVSSKDATLVPSADASVNGTAVDIVNATGIPSASGRSSVIPTPQKALNFSAAATLSKEDTQAAMPAAIRHRIFSSSSSSSSPCAFPWAAIVRFATMEVLMVCRAVCSALRAASVPLLRVNWRFMAKALDIPQGARGSLLRCARDCAAVMANATRRRGRRHPDPLLRCCARHLLRALQAIVGTRMKSFSRWNVVKEKCRGVLLSPADVAVEIAANGFFDDASDVESEVGSRRDDDNTVDGVLETIQIVLRCDVNALPSKALQCIAAAFEEVHIAAAASFALSEERRETLSNDRVTQSSHFISLTEFFDHYGLLPLVDYLNALAAVAHIKANARFCLERVRGFDDPHRVPSIE